ncbi:BAI1-associated protein 3, partial [Stegodyphus mimosarum]
MSETDVFELFLVLQEFSRFKDCLPKEDQSSLIIANCHVWFADAVNQWFSVAKIKVRGRIYHAFEHDKALMENKSPAKELKPTNKSQQLQLAPLRIKYSVSAIDTVLSFIQLKEFWHQLAWPDKCSSYPYVL